MILYIIPLMCLLGILFITIGNVQISDRELKNKKEDK